MRETPTWRIPLGILGLFAALMIYGLVIARYAPALIGHWPPPAQTAVYMVLGLVWLLPLRRFVIWMETGRWRSPGPEKEKPD
jgi:hypothetical protein